jgi:hypothetical protein
MGLGDPASGQQQSRRLAVGPGGLRPPGVRAIKRFFRSAFEDGFLNRLFGHRAPCLLLARGFKVSRPQCGVCARDLDLPNRSAETFLLAAPIAASAANAHVNGASNWLFFGTKVLVAAVSSHLAAVLSMSVAFFGEKVVVAMVRRGGGNLEPLVLCKTCGAQVLARVYPASQQYYGWDWLAKLEPRPLRARYPVLQRLARIRRFIPSPG